MNIHTNEEILEFPFPESGFLDTAYRVKMNSPIGQITYLEMEITNTSGDSDDPGIGQVSLRPMTKVIQSETHEANSVIKKDHIQDLQKMGIDMNSQMFSVLDNESLMMMQKKLHTKYLNLGNASQEKMLSKWKKFLRKYFKIEHILYVESSQLANKILLLSKMIAIKTRRGPANFVIVSPMINSLLTNDSRFVFNEFKSINTAGEICSTGRIGNEIVVFVDPLMSYDDSKIILGRSTDHGNVGVVIGEYSRQGMKLDDYGSIDFSPEIKYMIRDRYVIEDVGSSPENSFLTTKLKIGKKPLWKKLIGA